MRPNEVRKVQSAADPDVYNVMTLPQMNRMTAPLWLEGVDGDEETNTVVYYYTRHEPE